MTTLSTTSNWSPVWGISDGLSNYTLRNNYITLELGHRPKFYLSKESIYWHSKKKIWKMIGRQDLLSQVVVFFSIWIFFHEHWRFTGQQEKGKAYLFSSSSLTTRLGALNFLYSNPLDIHRKLPGNVYTAWSPGEVWILEETLLQVLSCESCEIFQTAFLQSTRGGMNVLTLSPLCFRVLKSSIHQRFSSTVFFLI